MKWSRRLVFSLSSMMLCMVVGCAPAHAVKTTMSNPETTSSEGTSDTGTPSAGQSNQQNPKTEATSDSIHLLAPHLQMLNDTNGFLWGYKKNAFELSYTTNAGVTWSSVSLPSIPNYDVLTHGPGGKGFVRAVFLDDTHAYLTWFQNGDVHFAYTADNGTSWQAGTCRVPSDASQIASIQFVNHQLGFLLVTGDTNASATVKYLYRTANGGKTWKLINSSKNQLPHNGETLKIAFAANGKDGIMVASQSDSSHLSVLETKDGGKTWTSAQVTLPSSIQDVTNMITSAEYIQGTTGQITALIETDKGNITVVMRQDNQHNWTTNMVKQSPVLAMTWTESGLGYEIVSEAKHQIIKQTDDAGATWVRSKDISSEVPSTDTILQLCMQNDGTGWLLTQDESLQPKLLLTTDSGQTFSTPKS